jgi:PST family polysaccharide transporter
VIGIGDTVRDFGLSSAAIQAPRLGPGQRSNLFWTNTGIGLVLGLLVAACAAPLSHLYHQPALVPITQALSVTFLLNGMMTQYRAGLLRAMRFRAVATIDVVSPATALIGAVGMALAGAGYWALVAQQLVQAVVALIAVVAVGRWWPSPHWHRGEPMREFFRFGGHLLASQLIGYVANNIDSFTIGRRFGAEPLGLYNRAFQLLMTPLNQVRAPSTTVALPVLSRAGRGPQYDAIVRAGQLVLGYPVTIALAVVIGTADPLVTVLLGAKWAAVPPILRLLAVAGVMQTLSYVGYWVYLSRGLTRELMQYTLVTSAIKIACVVTGSTWGVVGVAAGYALAPMIAWPMSLWWLSRITDLPVADLYRGAFRVLGVGVVVGLVTAAASTAVATSSAWVTLAIGLAAGAGATAALLMLPALRRDAHDLVHVLGVALRSRRG